MEGYSTSLWRQTEDQEVNGEIWDWCQLPGRLPQPRLSFTNLNGVPRWLLPLNFGTNTSHSGLVYVETGYGLSSVDFSNKTNSWRVSGAGTQVPVCAPKMLLLQALHALPTELGQFHTQQ